MHRFHLPKLFAGLFALLLACSLSGCVQGSTLGTQAPSSDASAESSAQASWTEMSWSDLSALSARLAGASTVDERNEMARDAGIYTDDNHLTNTTRRIDLTNGYAVDVRVIGVCHDVREDGSTVGLTLATTGAVGRSSMNSTDTVSGGWEASSLRATLASDYLALFPSEVSQVMVPVAKQTNNRGLNDDPSSVSATVDTLWLPSVHEVCGNVAWEQSEYGNTRFGIDATVNAEGSQYQYFQEQGVNAQNANASLTLDATSGKSAWWLRTPFPQLERTNGEGAFFFCVSNVGNPENYVAPSQQAAVVACFCV